MREKDVRLERLRAQGYRDDVEIETVAVFLSLIANGMALRRTLGDPMPDLDDVAKLVEGGVGRRPTPRPKRPRTKRRVSAA
jgi:hypothetical protein